MTFSNAVQSMSLSGSYNAAKIPSWHGYVYKTNANLTEDEIAAGKFKVIFVKSNGDQFVFTYDGVADYSFTGYIANSSGELGTGSAVAGTNLVVDPDLLEALLSDRWETNSQEYLDGQRTSEGEWD